MYICLTKKGKLGISSPSTELSEAQIEYLLRWKKVPWIIYKSLVH